MQHAPRRCERRGGIAQRQANAPGAIVDTEHSHSLSIIGVIRTFICALALACGAAALAAQTSPETARDQAQRAQRRIRALQAEADRLAAQSRTVFSELQRLELERSIKHEELLEAERELARISAERDATATRLKTLEATRVASTPGVSERLVELSKRGRAGYVQLLLASNDVRAMGRMARGVAAVAELDRVRLDTHRKTIAAEQSALAELTTQRTALAAAQKNAARAKTAADAAVTARNRMIDDLDRRRDLAAQYVAELQQAHQELQRTVANSEAASKVTVLPIRPFRGDLPWPINGRVTERFGRATAGRFGTTIVRNGIEVAAAEGTAVTAVHEGTVAYAAPFTGFGTLVIVDHGQAAFTLYGNLSEAVVTPGTNVSRGTPVGTLGQSPSGGAALYFEVRIDGRPVDPLQWLGSQK